MQECDFLVIGAGIAGASAGFELAAHGRVLVLEREHVAGYHTTGRSAAMFLETYGNETVRRLTKASRAFFERPPEGFSEAALLAPRGAMHIARTDQLDALARALAEVRPLTPTVEELDFARARALVPVLREGYVARALYEPGGMDIDTHALHDGYLRGLRRRGGILLTQAEVQAIGREGGRWRMRTRAGEFAAGVIVNAAGAWCDEVARLAGVRPIGLVPKRRTLVTVAPPPGIEHRAWPVVLDVEEQFYFKPSGAQILATPADETPMAPCDVQPDELDVAVTAERIERATTLEIRRIESKWAGLRNFVRDKCPVVGMEAESPGFFWLAGQGGFGMQTAPAMARLAASLLTRGALPEDLAALGLRAEHVAPERLRA